MYYDLSSFGSYICKRRKSMGYTQKDIASLTCLSTDSLRKMENGKVLPNQITLELLSLALEEDLNLTLLSYRLDREDNFLKVEKDIDNKRINNQYNNLAEDYEIIKVILNNLKLNSYNYKLIKELSLLVEPVILRTDHFQYKESLDKLVYTIKLTTPSFSLKKYREFYYTDIEINLLIIIALLKNKLGKIDSYQEILLFCLDQIDESNIDLRLRIILILSHNFNKKAFTRKP